ncbi:MAG: S41 family peptidase, partial [Tepidisphaeraceae bacterium]
MFEAGYYRFPTIHNDTVVFVSEDDLWSVPASGGEARRLTSGLGTASNPALSRDGQWLAFSGREEGAAEVYVMPALGGQPTRLTFNAAGIVGANISGWTPDGRIVFCAPFEQPFNQLQRAFTIERNGGTPQMLPTGPASFVSFGSDGQCVISRPSVDSAYWKRYRGGTAGDLWVDPSGKGEWKRLIKLEGNPSRPLWVGKRVYFICDHEGVGNLYSCEPSGKDLKRHSNHQDFYVRTAATDGKRIVYHAGADLFQFDPQSDKSSRIDVRYHSPRTQRNRKFVDAAKYVESFAPHPQGHLLALTTRGKVATLGNFDGPVRQLGEPCAGRYRIASWLNDGKRLVAVCDDGGRESLVILHGEELAPPARLENADVSRVVGMKVSPRTDHVVLSNVRNELIHVDLVTRQTRVLDRSEHSWIQGFDISPDGKWVAYSWNTTLHTAIIRLCRLEDGKIFNVTRPVLQDIGPAFDPEGKYLYFLSRREFDPVYDGLHFELSFPKGMRPYLVTLRKDLVTPFALVPRAPEEPAKKPDEPEAKKPEDQPLVIDTDGIEDRILAFPVPEGIYQQIAGIKGKALFTSVPIEGSLKHTWLPGADPPAKATLDMWEFENAKSETVVRDITSFALSEDRKTLVYRAGNRLRILKAGEKSDDALAKEPPGRKSGWIDFKRVRISVEPLNEWKQMYDEAWRLQREQFWTEDMADVDWRGAYERYKPLLERVSTRGEFADLLWEMQGELGSSHAYAVGGDFRDEPKYDIGFLGAQLEWDERADSWKVRRIVRGDGWDEESGSPLLRPGVNVSEGDMILAVNSRRATRETSPNQLLVHQAGMEVALTVADAQGKSPRVVMIKTIRNEMPLYYRNWVESNRAFVREKTDGRCGYLHVPNMGPLGFAEFHRGFLSEVD